MLTQQLLPKASVKQYKRTHAQLHDLLDIADMAKDNQNSRMRHLCDQVILHRKSLDCVFSLQRIADAIDLDYENETHTIRQPITWRLWGAEQKLVLGHEPTSVTPESSIQALQDATLKALTWNEALLDGRITDLREIESEEQASSPYIRRILRLAYLSPEILQAIVKGNITDGLHVEAIRTSVPMKWKTQAQRFVS